MFDFVKNSEGKRAGAQVHLSKILMLAGLVSVGSMITGCRTEDELIGRPWNTPKSWESGLPSSMTEGR